jgi:hypothetical protein
LRDSAMFLVFLAAYAIIALAAILTIGRLEK